MPAPSVRSSALRSSSDAGATSITLAAPGTIVSGDLLLAFIVGYSIASGTVTLPSGWTVYNEAFYNVGADLQYFWAYKTATGSEPGSYTFTNSDSDSGWWTGAVLCLQDATAPEAHGRSTSVANSGDIPHPSVTTIGDNRLIVLGAHHAISSSASMTPPSGYTEHQQDANANINGGLTIASKVQASTGASGAQTTVVGSSSSAGKTGGTVSIPGTPGYVDAEAVALKLTPSGIDEQFPTHHLDVGTVYIDLQPSALEERQRYDAGTVYVDLQPSGVDGQHRVDAGTVYVDLTPSAHECHIKFQPSFIGEGWRKWQIPLSGNTKYQVTNEDSAKKWIVSFAGKVASVPDC